MKIHRTCQDVTRLVLESEDRRLVGLERLSMRLHWMICESCRRFVGQQRLMRVALDCWRGYRDGE